MVKFPKPNLPLGQHGLDGVPGKAGIVPAAGEAFLLGCRHGHAIHHQRGGAVMIKGGNAENAHRLGPNRQNSV